MFDRQSESETAGELFQLIRVDIARISDVGKFVQLGGADKHRHCVAYR